MIRKNLRSYQFSLLTLTVVVTISAFVALWVARQQVPKPEIHKLAVSTTGRIWAITTCHVNHELAYVIFIGRPIAEEGGAVFGDLRGPSGSWEQRGDTSFPKRGQLFENVDGKYRDSDRVVTAKELEAFMSSRPDAFTIDGLLAFVDKARANTPKK